MRAILLDQRSIRFLSEEELDELERIARIAPYLKERRAEIKQYIDVGMPVTNVGVFREYIVAYLRSQPKIHKELTFLVRQLAPTPEGLPIQVYVFTNDTAWANYEAIQADIFDHLFASTPYFDLSVFQSPSGNDLAAIADSRLAHGTTRPE